ncbi:MAG: CHASE2 domain-containing protein [Acidobacteriia bacterium]|nr:CHASE2 domain-containing protein [Terriglobia bacterium]
MSLPNQSRSPGKQRKGAEQRGWAYTALLAAVFLLSVWASYRFGAQVDNYSYDAIFRLYEPKPVQPESIILAIDGDTLDSIDRGMENIRPHLARALRLIDAVHPKAVAIDLILTNRRGTAADVELASAFRQTPGLVLSSTERGDPPGWEDPRPEFARSAQALGHVYAKPDEDAVTRKIPLDEHVGREQRWAIAFEAFRLSRGGGVPLESPSDVEVAGTVIPLERTGAGRLLRIRYLPPGAMPRVSMRGLLAHPQRAREFAGKVVFVGVTAPEMGDRLFTPYSNTSGIEIHAAAFETIAHRLFLTDVPISWPPLFSLVFIAAQGFVFAFLPGWKAYAAGAAVLAVALVTPYLFFEHQRVFPFAMPASSATLGFVAAAGWQTLMVRRNLRRVEAERTRYQQAMHFVTHEMRTPLSSIQGSSELISRYALSEQKQKQLAQLINSESRRLARMIEIFLNVERLSAGQMELKREDVAVSEMIATCVERARALAERKHIALELEPVAADLRLTGDRELLEHACYNLLTNAVKYSPQRTRVTISTSKRNEQIRLAVKDQGIGMDRKEVKKIFQKFYRTRKAEESGEAGTGIGLSIVRQIVEQHGGKIEVTSKPGVGSCFTLVLPAAAQSAPRRNYSDAETVTG